MAVVKINAIEVPEGAGPELERRFAARHGAVESAPGFLGFELLRPVAGDNRYFVYTRWETEEDFQAWRNGPGIQAHAGDRAKPVATGATLLEFEVVQSAQPRRPSGDSPTTPNPRSGDRTR
jgi:heme-degrading monooxygenase HmoA